MADAMLHFDFKGNFKMSKTVGACCNSVIICPFRSCLLVYVRFTAIYLKSYMYVYI